MDEQSRAVNGKTFKNGTGILFVLPVSASLISGFFAVINLYLSAGYVPKQEWDNYKKEQDAKVYIQQAAIADKLQGIAVGLALLTEQMKANDRQDRRLDELEKRLMEQERRH